MALSAGDKLGPYEILAPIGAGGMGKVYKVRNVISDRVEAMKVLLPDLATLPVTAFEAFTSPPVPGEVVPPPMNLPSLGRRLMA